MGANQLKSLHSSVGHNHSQQVGNLAESSLFGSTTRNMNFYHSTQKSLHGENLAKDSIQERTGGFKTHLGVH